MAVPDRNNRIPPAGSNPVPPLNCLAGRLRHYSDQGPGAMPPEFLPRPRWAVVDVRGQRQPVLWAGPVRRQGPGPLRWSSARPAVTAEDIRIHAWLARRLAALHHERHGLWPRLRRFLFGNRLARWLGLRPARKNGSPCPLRGGTGAGSIVLPHARGREGDT
jgi:hypothetical protein